MNRPEPNPAPPPPPPPPLPLFLFWKEFPPLKPCAFVSTIFKSFMATVPDVTWKPRYRLAPDSVKLPPLIVTFLVTFGRREPSVMFDVKVIVSPFAALLIALVNCEASLTL